jgi:hypothetical protein
MNEYQFPTRVEALIVTGGGILANECGRNAAIWGKVLYRLVFGLICAVGVVISTQGQNYLEISGSVDMQITRIRSADHNTNTIHRTIPFDCVAGTNDVWRIDEYLKYLGGSEDKIFFDGTIMYLGVQIPNGDEKYAGRSVVQVAPFDPGKSNSLIQICIDSSATNGWPGPPGAIPNGSIAYLLWPA